MGKHLQNDFGSLPSRSTSFAGPGCPVAVAGPKVSVLPSERTVPKGSKASRQKQNGVIITRFLTNRFDVEKMPRIVVSGGFRCGACWWLVAGTVLLCDFIIGSVLVCVRRKTAHVSSEPVFQQECLVLPHQTTKFCAGRGAFVAFNITFREG